MSAPNAMQSEFLYHLRILAEEDSQCARDWVEKKKAARAAIASIEDIPANPTALDLANYHARELIGNLQAAHAQACGDATKLEAMVILDVLQSAVLLDCRLVRVREAMRR
jgi:hypothetical protein